MLTFSYFFGRVRSSWSVSLVVTLVSSQTTTVLYFVIQVIAFAIDCSHSLSVFHTLVIYVTESHKFQLL